MRLYPVSGFAGRSTLPTRENPRDWYVWHFTPIENLPAILDTGALVSESEVGDHTSITDRGVRDRRQRVRIDSAPYAYRPPVADHVPWYFTTKTVTHLRTRSHRDEIVFLGMNLGTLMDSGLPWIASNGNAAVGTTEFSHEAEAVSDFIDFDLMKQRMWNDTADDPDRMSRRCAEVLVYREVPLELIEIVAVNLPATAEIVDSILGGSRYPDLRAVIEPELFY